MKTTIDTEELTFKPIKVTIKIESVTDLRRFLIATSLGKCIKDQDVFSIGKNREMVDKVEIQQAIESMIGFDEWEKLTEIYKQFEK